MNSKTDIIPTELAVHALRDSGYKNTAYALSELIDNSVQAHAENVEVIYIEKFKIVKDRQRRQLDQIAVIDNGGGMTPEILEIALQFGNGTRLRDRSGIGRFGMGLPNSSISQCRRVEVWTWQAGADNAMYSYLDVDLIEKGKLKTVPEPIHMPLPDKWREKSDIIGTTGTLVLWSELDMHRLTWSGAEATLKHTSNLVGRIHRRFIDAGLLEIRMISIDDNEQRKEQSVKVNDPLYLMSHSSTPPPFDSTPMFKEWGDGVEKIRIDYGGKIHEVRVRISIAKEDTVPKDGSDRGNQPYGKDAAKNIGVSILRADRELDLDQSWAGRYDPIERWWGIEVEFLPALDEVFGVTINKQAANNFSGLANFDLDAERGLNETESDCIERLVDNGDPKGILWPIAKYIRDQISQLRQSLRKQTVGTRRGKRHERQEIGEIASKKFVERAEQHPTEYDNASIGEEDLPGLEQDLVEDKGYPENVAQDIANAVLTNNRRVMFVSKAIDSPVFFTIEHKHGGLTSIVFNESHPFYNQLVDVLSEHEDDLSADELRDKLERYRDTIKLLFCAWARYEMEATKPDSEFPDIRQEWGRMAKAFLKNK